MQTGAPFFYDVPHGLEEVVMYYKQRYNNTATYITENGVTLSCLFFSKHATFIINQSRLHHPPFVDIRTGRFS
jgi:beta-glucosidase